MSGTKMQPGVVRLSVEEIFKKIQSVGFYMAFNITYPIIYLNTVCFTLIT